MKSCLIFMSLLILSSCSCGTEQEYLEEATVISPTEALMEEEPIQDKKKDYGEIILERPEYKALIKIEAESIEKIQEGSTAMKSTTEEEPKEELDETGSPIIEQEEKKEEDKDESQGEAGFVFEAYYSAEIGSQGLFDDVDSATEEGWRISELEDPSAYLGFLPSGWEVYPVWYYPSPQRAIKYYTLNFYP